MLKDCHGYTALQLSAMYGQETSIEVILKHLPIAQHIVIYQEALEFSKERISFIKGNGRGRCTAFIEQALLHHALKNDLSPIDLMVQAPNIKLRNNRL